MKAKVFEHNRVAWNQEAREGCEWTLPVDGEVIARARTGDWRVKLTPNKAVPAHWFPPLAGRRVLCLASGGGQQAPILAAAGAAVVSLDLSEEQLARDRQLAQQEHLDLTTVQGTMTNLSMFAGESFDLVFHAASNLFVPEVRPVWRECHRVLRPGGVLLAGFMNPVFYLFDHEAAKAAGVLQVKFPLPYSDLTSLTAEQQQRFREERRTLEFGHSLEDQIGGQIEAGFAITGFYEDYWEDAVSLLNVYSPTSMATRALKT